MTFSGDCAIFIQYVKKTKQSSTLTSAHGMRLGFILHSITGIGLCISGYMRVWIFVRTFFHVYERPGLRLFFPEIQRATRSQGFMIYYVWRCTTISNLMINEQIRDKEVRLIGADGAQLGIMSAKEAMFKAQEAGLDLVKIAPQAKPPVCKIIDYGKYRYELARKEKEARKKQKTIDVKEVRLSPNIDTNDLKTKVNAARKFLTKGDRVKVTLRFRGREMAHMASSRHVLDDFAEFLADIATVEKAPKVEGRSMTMFLSEKR